MADEDNVLLEHLSLFFDGLFQQRLSQDFSSFPSLNKEKLRHIFLSAVKQAKADPQTESYFLNEENSISDYAMLLDYCTGQGCRQPCQDFFFSVSDVT